MAVANLNDREFSYTQADFERVRKIIYKKAGINLSDSKKQLVYSRLARRLRALKLPDFSAYLSYLENTDEEQQEFVNALTTNLTAFFREEHHFDFLAEFVKNFKHKRNLRVWCAAASTGEEPYSIAITLAEAFGRYDPPVEIIASDIDSNVLNEGRAGVYNINRIESLSLERKRQFFLKGKGDKNAGKVKVIPDLGRLIEFKQINLLDAKWPLTGLFDVIFCRNVMIYFDKSTQVNLLEKMVKLMQKDGLYIAGHSESFSQANHLVKLVGKTVYRLADVNNRNTTDES
ncbi:MAG: chemotaxis protein CheR [Cellvibrio sp.]|nr:chemotaxis protein CheR [Cellvibrio sp.]